MSKQLRAEIARGDGRIKRKEDVRRQNIQPNETLFVVNFHEETTRKEDLEMLFSPYGELVRIDMKKNYAFVQFANVDQARTAKDATNGGKLDQSVITVEYVARRDDNRREFRRDHDDRRDYRRRSPNRHDRRSPDRYRSRRHSPDRSRYHRRSPRRSPERNYRRRDVSRSRSRSPFHRRGKFRPNGSPPRNRDSHRRYDDRGDDRRERGAGFRSDDRGYAGRENENN